MASLRKWIQQTGSITQDFARLPDRIYIDDKNINPADITAIYQELGFTSAVAPDTALRDTETYLKNWETTNKSANMNTAIDAIIKGIDTDPSIGDLTTLRAWLDTKMQDPTSGIPNLKDPSIYTKYPQLTQAALTELLVKDLKYSLSAVPNKGTPGSDPETIAEEAREVFRYAGFSAVQTQIKSAYAQYQTDSATWQSILGKYQQVPPKATYADLQKAHDAVQGDINKVNSLLNQISTYIQKNKIGAKDFSSNAAAIATFMKATATMEGRYVNLSVPSMPDPTDPSIAQEAAKVFADAGFNSPDFSSIQGQINKIFNSSYTPDLATWKQDLAAYTAAPTVDLYSKLMKDQQKLQGDLDQIKKVMGNSSSGTGIINYIQNHPIAGVNKADAQKIFNYLLNHQEKSYLPTIPDLPPATMPANPTLSFEEHLYVNDPDSYLLLTTLDPITQKYACVTFDSKGNPIYHDYDGAHPPKKYWIHVSDLPKKKDASGTYYSINLPEGASGRMSFSKTVPTPDQPDPQFPDSSDPDKPGVNKMEFSVDPESSGSPGFLHLNVTQVDSTDSPSIAINNSQDPSQLIGITTSAKAFFEKAYNDYINNIRPTLPPEQQAAYDKMFVRDKAGNIIRINSPKKNTALTPDQYSNIFSDNGMGDNYIETFLKHYESKADGGSGQTLDLQMEGVPGYFEPTTKVPDTMEGHVEKNKDGSYTWVFKDITHPAKADLKIPANSKNSLGWLTGDYPDWYSNPTGVPVGNPDPIKGNLASLNNCALEKKFASLPQPQGKREFQQITAALLGAGYSSAEISSITDLQAGDILNSMGIFENSMQTANNGKVFVTPNGTQPVIFPGFGNGADKLNNLVDSIVGEIGLPAGKTDKKALSKSLYNGFSNILTKGQAPSNFQYPSDFDFSQLQSIQATAIMNRKTPITNEVGTGPMHKITMYLSAIMNLGIPPSDLDGKKITKDEMAVQLKDDFYTASYKGSDGKTYPVYNVYERMLHAAGDTAYAYDYDDCAGLAGLQTYVPGSGAHGDVHITY